jgi:hypothetical protein
VGLGVVVVVDAVKLVGDAGGCTVAERGGNATSCPANATPWSSNRAVVREMVAIWA